MRIPHYLLTWPPPDSLGTPTVHPLRPVPDPDRQFTILSWDTDAGMVLSLGGELDVAGAPDLLARVQALTEQGYLRIVVDLRHLEFCDCSGLRALLGAQRIAASAGGWTRLAHISRRLLWLIALVGLSEALPGYCDAAAAFAAP